MRVGKKEKEKECNRRQSKENKRKGNKKMRERKIKRLMRDTYKKEE